MSETDVYAISGRIKNILARDDIALSPVGTILVNYLTLFLLELHEFAEEKLDEESRKALKEILLKNEDLPHKIISLATPKEEILPDDFVFESEEKALEYYTKEYENLGAKYGLTGDQYWAEAESSSLLNEDDRRVMTLYRRISMCKYLIKKRTSDG